MEASDGKQNEKETSSEEFQNKLCVWFEEKGVLAELRTHLRHQMIETLKTSQIGRQMSSEKKKNVNISPKHQAINLLIAEYLLHQGYQYSMSVFSSEVGTLYSLPEHTLRDPQGGMRFQGRDVADILESLGLPVECEEAQCIAAAYSDAGSNRNIRRDCLLVCLLRMLPTVLRSKYHKEATNRQDKVSDVVNGSIEVENGRTRERRKMYRDGETQCGGGGGGKQQDLEVVVRQIHENMQQAFDNEIEIAKEEERQRYASIIEEKERAMREQMEEERKKVKKIENRMRENIMKEVEEERSRMCEEYRMKEIQLERETAREMELERYKILSEYREMIQSKKAASGGPGHANMADIQHSQLSAALDKLQEQSDKLKLKEDLLDKRLKEVEEHFNTNHRMSRRSQQQSDLMTQTNIQLQEERNNINKLKCDLEKLVKQMEDDRQCKVETVCKDVQTEKVISCRDTQTDYVPSDNNASPHPANNNVTTHRTPSTATHFDFVLKTLQKENSQLKSLTTQQSSKVEELMLKQLNMSMEVSEARVQVQELSKQLKHLLNRPPAAPVTPNRRQVLREMLSGRYTTKPKKKKAPHSSYTSQGNKCLNNLSDSSSEETQVTLQRNRSSASRSKRGTKYNNTEGEDREDDSPTDEVLKDAKRRLRMLELETEAVDRSYQEFKLRQEMEREGGVKKDKERRRSAPPTHPNHNTTDSQRYKSNSNKPDVATSTSSHYVTPKYNMFRRVHETTMNIDNNVLHNYISTNKIKHQPSLSTTMLYHPNNILQTNRLFTSNVSSANKFAGTTAFLLKRIENCTLGIRKYNMEKQNNIESHLTVDWKSKGVTRKECNSDNKNTNYMSEDYSQYIGKTSLQYKIKPTIHWRNIQNVQKITQENKLPDDVVQNEINSCGDKVIKENNCINDEETFKTQADNNDGNFTSLEGTEKCILDVNISKKDKGLNQSKTQSAVEDEPNNKTFPGIEREDCNVSVAVLSNVASESLIDNTNHNNSSIANNLLETLQPAAVINLEVGMANVSKESEMNLSHISNTTEVNNKLNEVSSTKDTNESNLTKKNDQVNKSTITKKHDKTENITTANNKYNINDKENDQIKGSSDTQEANGIISKLTAIKDDEIHTVDKDTLNDPTDDEISQLIPSHEDDKVTKMSDGKDEGKINDQAVKGNDEIKELSPPSGDDTITKMSDGKEENKMTDPTVTKGDGEINKPIFTKENDKIKELSVTYEDDQIIVPHPPSDKEYEVSSYEVSEASCISAPQVEDDEDESFWK